jgi:hypothetical protein
VFSFVGDLLAERCQRTDPTDPNDVTRRWRVRVLSGGTHVEQGIDSVTLVRAGRGVPSAVVEAQVRVDRGA